MLQGKTELDDNVWQLSILYKLLHNAECSGSDSYMSLAMKILLLVE